MITTKNGTLIVFAQARVHSTDATPSSVVMRRSFDDGASWEPTRVVLPDFFNTTEQVGESLYDPVTDTIFFFENHVDFRNRHPGCSTCNLWQMSSADHGLTVSSLSCAAVVRVERARAHEDSMFRAVDEPDRDPACGPDCKPDGTMGGRQQDLWGRAGVWHRLGGRAAQGEDYGGAAPRLWLQRPPGLLRRIQ